jgi:Flp pilus assembly protein TadD
LLFNNFGMSYLLQHRFDEAMAQFQKAITLDPNQNAARANMRMAYALQGKYVEALAGVPQEDMADALNNVGYAATLRGDYEAARAYFARALETSPAFHKKASANMQQLEGIVDIANAAAP